MFQHHISLLILFILLSFVGCDGDHTPVVQPGAKSQGENVIETQEKVETIPATETRSTIIKNTGTKRIQIKFNYDPPIIRSLAPGKEINADPLKKGYIPTRLICEEGTYAHTEFDECVTYR